MSPRGLGSMSRGFVDEKTNSLIAAFRYPGRIGFLGRMDLATGKLTPLTDLDGMMLYKVTSVAFDPSTRTAFYTDQNYAYREINAIDVDTGRKRRLLTDARIGDLAFNPADKSLWGIRHQNGFVTLVRIPPPYTSFNQVKTFRYGEIIFDLDISPDGELVSASYGTRRRQAVGQGVEARPTSSWAMPTMRSRRCRWRRRSRRISPSRRTARRCSAIPIIPACRTSSGSISRAGKHEVLTNASTGFFRPQLRPDGSLLVYDYAGEGFNPSIVQPQVREDLATVRFLGTEVVNARPELKEWGVGSPAKVPLDELVTARGTYDPLRRMRFDAHYPIVSGYDRSPAFGYYLHLADPLQFRQLSATVAVSPFNKVRGGERLHLNVEYQTPNWKLTYWHNLADVYDLAGPVLRSRKGDAFIASYSKPLIYDPPRQLDVFGSASAFFGLKQLPGAQNIASPKEPALGRSRRALHQHDKGAGRGRSRKGPRRAGSWPARTRRRATSSRSFTAASTSAWRCRGETARRGCTRMPASPGGRRFSPLAAFYFGSFRNNYVDDRPEKRYREVESFPGFAIDEIAARRYAKVTGEVNLPPIRFAEVGTAAFYLSHIRPAVFGSVLATQAPDGASHRYVDVGAQLDLNFTVALRLPMVLSVGAASGWADGDYRKTELLVSLKIM